MKISTIPVLNHIILIAILLGGVALVLSYWSYGFFMKFSTNSERYRIIWTILFFLSSISGSVLANLNLPWEIVILIGIIVIAIVVWLRTFGVKNIESYTTKTIIVLGTFLLQNLFAIIVCNITTLFIK